MVSIVSLAPSVDEENMSPVVSVLVAGTSKVESFESLGSFMEEEVR